MLAAVLVPAFIHFHGKPLLWLGAAVLLLDAGLWIAAWQNWWQADTVGAVFNGGMFGVSLWMLMALLLALVGLMFPREQGEATEPTPDNPAQDADPASDAFGSGIYRVLPAPPGRPLRHRAIISACRLIRFGMRGRCSHVGSGRASFTCTRERWTSSRRTHVRGSDFVTPRGSSGWQCFLYSSS